MHRITTAHAKSLSQEGYVFAKLTGAESDNTVLILKINGPEPYLVEKDGKPVKASTLPTDPYIANGFESRRAYLDDLADQHGVEPTMVYMMADMLGPSEDFDGLVTSIEDGACDW